MIKKNKILKIIIRILYIVAIILIVTALRPNQITDTELTKEVVEQQMPTEETTNEIPLQNETIEEPEEEIPEDDISLGTLMYTNVKCNVRDLPSLEGKVIKTLAINSKVTQMGFVLDWAIVRLSEEDKTEYYIYKSLLSEKETIIEPTSRAATPRTTATTTGNLKSLGTYTLTAYCGCMKCCGKTNCITASGVKATAGRTIAAPKTFSFGTKISIDGHTYTVEDRGGAIKGNRIDIYFNSHSEALAFGRKTMEIFEVE